MLRALELSTQDLSSRFDEAEEDAGQVVPESTEVNNDDCDDNEEVVTGPPEFSYKLTSIVSHFGASTAAGHYVADVYRSVFATFNKKHNSIFLDFDVFY